MTYKDKAKILTQHFGLYGIGHFDLSLEEIAYILELIEKEKDYLEINLNELYERLEKLRMG